MNQFQGKWALARCTSALLAFVSIISLPASAIARDLLAESPKAKADLATQEPASVVPDSRPDEGWMDKHDKLVKLVKASHPDIAFFGDSITEGMNVDLLHKIISPEASNFGIGGDRTQHLLWRMQNGELDFASPPRAFVVLIGTNNISNWPKYPSSTNQEIYLGVKADLNEIRGRFPKAKILLLAILPRDEKPVTKTRQRVNETNTLLKGLADKNHIWYADIGASLLEADGKLSPGVMSDFLHPTAEEGYTRMFKAIKPDLDLMLGHGKTGK